jgi:DNA-binding transcriptional ArsR family regulator
MVHKTTVIFKALADDTRLTIVRKLASMDKPVPSCDIVEACASFAELSQPAMSHHFSKLVDAGVVTEQKKGVQKLYTLNTELLDTVGVNPNKL